jgi:hypothetical protein
MGHLSPEKRALFSLLKKVGGTYPLLPPCSAAPAYIDKNIANIPISYDNA